MPYPQEVDAVVVGGGPCGLTLAKGLLDQGYSVVIIEKERLDLRSHDWSKAYSFRVDTRGLRLLKSLGLRDKLTGDDDETALPTKQSAAVVNTVQEVQEEGTTLKSGKEEVQEGITLKAENENTLEKLEKLDSVPQIATIANSAPKIIVKKSQQTKEDATRAIPQIATIADMAPRILKDSKLSKQNSEKSKRRRSSTDLPDWWKKSVREEKAKQQSRRASWQPGPESTITTTTTNEAESKAESRIVGVKSEGFKGTNWLPDGNFVARPPRTLGSCGYWIMRPKFLKLLNDAVPDRHKIQGEVTSIQFDEDEGTVLVSLGEEGEGNTTTTTIRGKYLFGCDGMHSRVRCSLAATVDAAYEINKIDCPSAGLTFRATLYDPPNSLDPEEAYMIMGTTGERLTMLPFGGEPGQPRPIAVSQQSSYRFFQAKTEKELYDMLDDEFPQLHVRERLSVESARAWIETEGSTFPRPRWAGKACGLYKGVFVCILGDALHSFPPDLGQGLNSGMVDVERVLAFMKENNKPTNEWEPATVLEEGDVALLNEELVSEANAVCQLLPIGMPYQYKMPFSLQKVWFFADFMSRWGLHELVSKSLFHAPAILEIQDDPPKKYTTILDHHHQTTRRMLTLFGSLGAGIVGSYCLLRSRRREH